MQPVTNDTALQVLSDENSPGILDPGGVLHSTYLYLFVSVRQGIHSLTSFLRTPSRKQVMMDPTAQATIYRSGCPTVAKTKMPP